MEQLKNKLNSFRKHLSVQHLSRDIVGAQLLIFASAIIAALIFIWIVSYASGSSDPNQVMQTAETTSGYLKWILFIGLNLLVMIIGGKARREAEKDKTYILDNFEEKKPVEEKQE